jgi:hypothetical protein
MNIRNLHLGKAMRAALFVLLLTAGMTKSFAQTRVATLQHGDEITAFYGTNALSQAHAAAESGDVITLSSGTFNACDITKAITLRGAGCYEDTLTGVQPTCITNGNVHANITEATTYFLTIEGIWFESSFYHNALNNPWFNKCDFAYFGHSGSGIMQNATFVNCRIRGYYYNTNSTNIFMINSLLLSGVYNVSATCSLTLNNSIMVSYSNTSSDAAFVAYNSILINSSFGYGCSLYNCLTLNNSSVSLGNPFMVDCLNYSISYGSTVFVGWISPGNNGFIDQSFELKQSFINSFVGTDGTQIGIYGGNVPYNKLPAYVRTQVNVASQSTDDGMLNVEVEIIDEDE